MTRADLDISIDQRSAVPLYEQICQQIRSQIEARVLGPGAQLPTNHELRARLQVNYKTAQLAMATLAKEGYVTRQARRGTVVKGIPRRGVVAVYSHIALVRQDSTFEFYRLITSHLSHQLETDGCVHRMYLGSITNGTPNTASDDLQRHLAGGGLAGIVLVNTPPHFDELVRHARSLRVPVVSLSGSGQADYSVRTDLLGYVRSAAAYLYKQGRRRVGVIFNSSSPAFRDPNVVAQILQEAGFEPNTSWIVGRTETEAGGYEAAASIPLAELDGLIVEDDLMAVGVDRRLCEVKLDVPHDLLLTTFWIHGSRLQLTMPFERFELDVANQARVSLQLIQDAISGRRIAEPHIKLVPIRGSSRSDGRRLGDLTDTLVHR